jgi:acetyl esterase/lipase
MKCIVGLFFLFISTNANSQSMKINLWPDGKIPLNFKTDIQEVVERTDIVRISKVQAPQLEVFLPNKKGATGQAVIICPGGGYSKLAYDWEGTDIAKLFNAHGIAAFVLKY